MSLLWVIGCGFIDLFSVESAWQQTVSAGAVLWILTTLLGASGCEASVVFACAFDAHEPPISLFMHSPAPHITRHGSAVRRIGAIPAATSQFQLRPMPASTVMTA